MCPNLPRAAILSIAVATVGAACIAGPAAAWPFGGPAAQKPAPAAAQPTPAKPAEPTPAAPSKATPQQRAEADRLEPVARVAFWTREFNADPKDLEAGVKLSQALRAVGRYAEAADSAGQLLTVRPGYGPALMEMARAEISADRGFYAIKALKQASALDPRDWRPWSLLGVAYEQNEQPDLARAAHEQAVRLGPDSPQALSNYALFRAMHGEPQAAEAMLRKAVASPGAGAPERQNLALVLGLEGKLAEAEQLIRTDLPPEAADTNLAYLRSLNAAPASAGAVRSYTAVQAAEAAQVKPPGR